MAVSRRLRYEILRRDNHRCKFCGDAAPEAKLTVDHVTPKALGGSDDPGNLVAACADCNSGKSATPPDAALVADVDEKAVAWAQAMNVVIGQRTAELAAERKRTGRFDRKWRTFRRHGDTYPRDVNWRNSVTRFFAEGLDDQFISDAIDTAMGRPKIPSDEVWRYFCGVCWREIDDLHKRTSALVNVPDAIASNGPSQGQGMPQGAGLDARFDVLNTTAAFLADIMEEIGVDPDIQVWVHRAYWNGMETAYEAFLADPSLADAGEEDPLGDAFGTGAAHASYHARHAFIQGDAVEQNILIRCVREALRLAHVYGIDEVSELVPGSLDALTYAGKETYTKNRPHPPLEGISTEALDAAQQSMREWWESFAREAGLSEKVRDGQE